jgi:hypothetical protein
VPDDALLHAVHERDDRTALCITYGETGAMEGFPTTSGRQLDDALQSAHDEGLVAGERAEGDGSIAYWFNLRLTVEGLRRLGEWPPHGREHQSGPWDDRWFGRYARPQLEALAAMTEERIVFRGDPLSLEEHRRWQALNHLRESGLIAGRAIPGALQDIRVAGQAE